MSDTTHYPSTLQIGKHVYDEANEAIRVNVIATVGGGGGGGSGTEYTEDAPSAANPVGPMAIARRRDTPAGETSNDGDNIALNATDKGELYVKHLDPFTITLPTGASTEAKQDAEIALLSTIDADTSALAGTVSGSELQVDVVTMPTVTVQATNLDVRDLVFASDKVDISGSTLAANSGVDIGDVTINNAAGAAAVNIQDGGNSLTVDGTITANIGTSGALALDASLTTLNTSVNTLLKPANTLAAVTSITNVVHVDDNAGSLTVDGTVSATQSGTWTVQPGNTANTTAWKVDGSAVTQPVSGTVTAISGTAANLKVEATIAAAQTLATVTTVSTVTAVTAITNALPTGTNIIGGVNPTPSGAAAQALSNDTSVAYEASSVTKASAGTVYGLTGYNSKTSAQFFQFFNSTTVPADTAVPVITFIVAASSNFSIDFGVYGRRFSTGIAWSNSSTGPTKTLGSADMFVDVNYV